MDYKGNNDSKWKQLKFLKRCKVNVLEKESRMRLGACERLSLSFRSEREKDGQRWSDGVLRLRKPHMESDDNDSNNRGGERDEQEERKR